MGFDNECILNIQSLAGEYFCPVCRTLVYPNEALQSQCTHLYCKPCLTYVVSTTSACPYDGYLVTEADAKPLIESNKALAETIGKIPVHCLYHRSGCTWQGALSECTSHCSGCAFGNSPVLCNRCGIQIVHRQVQEHAQNCPGVNTQAQQPTDDARDPAKSGTTTAVAQGQTVPQSAAPTSQSQSSQTATAPLTGQEQNQQANANPQAQVAVSVLPTPDQWYQQQYQQYYQQYPVYDTYQQNYQHYYPYPQQAIQQYQQPSVQAPQQSQVYPQAHSQPQLQPQARPQSLSQPRPQAQIQSQTLPPNPHSQPQQPQPSQASVSSQSQNQGQVNPQQQLHAAGQHNAPQIRPLLHSHMLPQPLAPPPQPHVMQPTSHQHMQLPQQSHSLIHFPHPHSQVPGPPHPQPQSQIQPQSQPYHQPQPLPQTHTQLQLQNHPSGHPQVHSAHSNQIPSSNALPQAQPQSQHPPPPHAVTGHNSYPQPQVHQQMQVGAHQHAMYAQPSGGPLPYPPVNIQLPQVPQMRPPHSHVQFSNQQQAGVQQQQMHPQGQQPGQLVTLHPGMQTIQQALPQQYAQQHQPFPAQAPVAVQIQLHGSYAHQQSVQPPALPQGPTHMIPQSQHVAGVHGMLPLQSQNYSERPIIHSSQPLPPTSGTFGVATHVRPMQLGPNQPSGYQTQENRTNNQLPSTTLQGTITEQHDHVFHNNVVDREDGSPSQKKAEIGVDSVDAKAVKSQSDLNAEHKHEGEGVDDSSKGETFSKENLGEPVVKNTVKEEASEGSLVASPGGSSVEIASLEKDATKVVLEGGSTIGKDESINGEPEKLPKDAVDVNLQTSTGVDHGAAVVPPFVSLPDQSRHQLPPMQYGLSTHQQRPTAPSSALHSVPSRGALLHAQVPGHPPSVVRPQVPGLLPQPGQVSNPPEHFQSFMGGAPDLGSSTSFERGPGQFDLPAPQGHYRQGLTPLPQAGFPPGVDPRSVIVERAPPPGSDGPYGPHRPINPLESEMFLKQRAQRFDGQSDAHPPRLLERGSFGQPSGSELSTMKINGSSGTESSSKVGLQDERFRDRPSEHLNPFLVEPSRHVAKGEFKEDLRRFSRPLHLDNDPGSYFNSARPFDTGSHGFGMGAAPRPLDTAQQAGLRLHSPASGAPARFFPHPNAAAEKAVPVGPLDDNRWRPDPSHINPEFIGSGFGRRYMDNTVSRSPGREYLRGFGGPSGAPHSYDDINIRERQPFGEGSRSYNLSDSVGNSFPGGRFPVMPVQSRRGELEHNHRIGDLIGQDTIPGSLRRGELLGPQNLPNHFRMGEPNNYGPFPGHARIGELMGTGNFPHHLPRGDSFGSNKPSNPRLGEPGFRSSYSFQGFARDSGYFSSDMDPFGKSRKRKATSMGWCRICKVDCETVEGLDLHSQTREHQKMAMDMVMSIKKQNAKKQKVLNDRSTTEVGSKPKNTSMEGRASKP